MTTASNQGMFTGIERFAEVDRSWCPQRALADAVIERNDGGGFAVLLA